MWKQFLCRFGWHSWTPWSEPKTTTPQWIELNPQALTEAKAQQFRKCTICNRQQRHVF